MTAATKDLAAGLLTIGVGGSLAAPPLPHHGKDILHDKPEGKKRQLGIPAALGRLVQQALPQAPQPHFETH